jgi:hypothetical protein
MMHGRYDFTLRLHDVPWWHGFLSFGLANLLAKVVLDKAGYGNNL